MAEAGRGAGADGWRTPMLLALVAQALFTWRLGTPATMVFDEIHYVPAARALIELSGPVNIEHPLFGKTLIALGIKLLGDTAVGWRAMSTLAGTATIVAVYAIVLGLTGRARAALFGGVMAIAMGTVLVQARIAMLDGFMAALVAAGYACLLWALKRRGFWALWLTGAVLLGLAVGTKWAAVPYVAFACIGVLVLRGRAGFVPAAALGLVAILVYFATFAPAFFYPSPMRFGDLIPFQFDMLDRQRQVLPPHTYQSDWWTWPIMLRPIWYLWEPVEGVQRGILLLANPVLAWGGLVLVAVLAWRAFADRSLRLAAPVALWLGSVLVWAVIPKSLGFYYYHYLSTIWLVIVVAVAVDRLRIRRLDEWIATAAIGMAAWFWPIWTAAPQDSAGFARYAWFDSWV